MRAPEGHTIGDVARLAEARSPDEAKDIRDHAEAMRAYALLAKNKQLEVDAAEIRIQAERRLGEMMAAQRDAGMMNDGGRLPEKTVVQHTPVSNPTPAEAGIDKNLAKRARSYAAIPEDEFDDIVTEWRDRVEQENRGDDPLSFVVSLNLARRHLTETQRAMVAGKVANMRREDTLKQNTEPQICGTVSNAQAAEMLSVSPRSVESARAVHDHAVPELREKAEAGTVSVAAALPARAPDRMASRIRCPSEDQTTTTAQ